MNAKLARGRPTHTGDENDALTDRSGLPSRARRRR